MAAALAPQRERQVPGQEFRDGVATSQALAHARVKRWGECGRPRLGRSSFPLILAILISAEAQQAGRVYRIGVLSPESPLPGLLENFREGLRKLGYVEGRNIAIEWRDAKGRNDQLGALAMNSYAARLTSFWR